ncbi:MAG: type IV pilin protein [Candidatus Avelusimicrobium sp.]|uniref:type IV pilin protein n=1 Tax=Candidatus Avelusimicrobium sp. TaxID=3048833 RepID=UPI003F0881C8
MVNLSRRGGFTLMELITVIIIVAILATFAWPSYERFIERMRLAEADSTMGSAVQAQDRYFVKRSQYTRYWHYLDAVPRAVERPVEGNDYANGSENTIYYSNGGANKPKEEARPGFAISFEADDTNHWFVVARRVGKGKYNYTLVRPFDGHQTLCLPSEENEDDLRICMDYSGAEDPGDLPEDPRSGIL